MIAPLVVAASTTARRADGEAATDQLELLPQPTVAVARGSGVKLALCADCCSRREVYGERLCLPRGIAEARDKWSAILGYRVHPGAELLWLRHEHPRI